MCSLIMAYQAAITEQRFVFKEDLIMGKCILAFIVTVLLGFGGIMLGNASDIPIPELGAVIAIAVMGAFIIYFNEKKK